MEIKKETRGRKPIKDKKKLIRIYLRDSEIKKLGGDKKLIKRIHEFIQDNIKWGVHNI